ncbi:MAG: hypothetical protein BGP24_14735 [Lysobacterales bacterium 69-70]|nr:hypothetical protein [Xanthomonadaceae bacterium]ODU35342.1 MAG: hypothetical protein ABS97_05565 [Xanthomonadaceae bacterium SCN 69-320]ODV17194.1 MAG: hypothetical protein ABT27_17675 [Xanthomonadaceae bacterium SCN 69-25]OJY94239.1 MAG: hypothetical protein BGP24_14735 [Xanthomonadales bacterium 69-70]
MTARRYEFEGQRMTVAEIRAIVPVISRSAVVQHIKAGRTTRQQMLQFDPRAAMRAGGKRGRIIGGRKLYIGQGKS